MIVKKISKITDALGFNSEVKQGYIQGGGAALPDIDIDYASDRREDVRKYVESRYNTNGQQRVFSCGTFNFICVGNNAPPNPTTPQLRILLINSSLLFSL